MNENQIEFRIFPMATFTKCVISSIFFILCYSAIFFIKIRCSFSKKKNSNIFSPPQENNEVKLQEWYLLNATRELGPIKENGLL